MLYVAECWEVKNQYENKISVAEMRMLRWIRDRIRQDMITLRESWGSTYRRKDGGKST